MTVPSSESLGAGGAVVSAEAAELLAGQNFLGDFDGGGFDGHYSYIIPSVI